MPDPHPRHRLLTARPSSWCCGHIHLFKVEVWNQASKLTHQVNLLTSHKEGRSISPHLETFLLQVPRRVFKKKKLYVYKLTISDDCYIQEFDNNLFFLFICCCFFFYFTILYWFCHTSTCICHGCTHVPHPEPPSHLLPHTIPLAFKT